MRRGLDLLPELRHEIVDRARRRRLFVAPHLIEDLLARDYLAGVRDKVAQEIEFAGSEIDPPPGAVGLMRAEVDVDVADAAGLEARRPAAVPAEQGAVPVEEH